MPVLTLLFLAEKVVPRFSRTLWTELKGLLQNRSKMQQVATVPCLMLKREGKELVSDDLGMVVCQQ
jgi:hypothetical protein